MTAPAAVGKIYSPTGESERIEPSAMTINSPSNLKTDAEQAAKGIREMIFHGSYAPSQRLVEADLSEQFGASRATIRTALTELAVEGLVEKMPNRGARVRAVSLVEALEIVEVRGALEALCAARAAARLTDAEEAELRAIGQAMTLHLKNQDQQAYSTQNQLLHQRLIEISGQNTAALAIRRLHAQTVRYQFQLWADSNRSAVSLHEHLAVIEAVCSRDPQRARESMLGHMHSVGEAIDSQQQNHPSSG